MDAKIMAKILLAEDEQNIASFIRRGLQEFGHEVQVAHERHGVLLGWGVLAVEHYAEDGRA